MYSLLHGRFQRRGAQVREVQLSTCYLPWQWPCCRTPAADTAGTAASTGSANETVKIPPFVPML